MTMTKFNVEYTDTFGGEANYSWVERHVISVPELTHYGYTGSADGSYHKANKAQEREVAKLAKAACGLTGRRGRSYWNGDSYEFRPYGSATVLFATFAEDGYTFND